MKIMISYQLDTVEEAQRVLDVVDAEFNFARVQVPRSVISPSNERMLAPLDVNEVKQPPGSVIPVTESLTRINKSPGAVSTTKIGTKTMEWVIEQLSLEDRVPEHFGTKNLENLKLLWSRGKIKFDGSHYYI